MFSLQSNSHTKPYYISKALLTLHTSFFLSITDTRLIFFPLSFFLSFLPFLFFSVGQEGEGDTHERLVAQLSLSPPSRLTSPPLREHFHCMQVPCFYHFWPLPSQFVFQSETWSHGLERKRIIGLIMRSKFWLLLEAELCTVMQWGNNKYLPFHPLPVFNFLSLFCPLSHCCCRTLCRSEF